jgi:hypothetical protein
MLKDRAAPPGRCWGSNKHGELGHPAVGVDQPSVIETDAIDGNAFDMKGAEHGCRVDVRTGLVSCWGSNDENQLGDGTRTSTYVPVVVRREAR